VGFAYLGVGVIVLLLWCWQMIVARPLDPFGFRPWTPLVVVCGALMVWSLLPRLAVGQYVLLDLTLYEPLAVEGGVFEASGRYLWPALYAFLFLVVALMVHAQRPHRAVLLLGLALALQLADLRPEYGRVRNHYRNALAESPAGLAESPDGGAREQEVTEP